MSFLTWLVGRPLASSEQDGQKLGVAAGVPAMGLDGLSSAAYGPEAALAILLPLGLAGLHLIIPITTAVVGLLFLLFLSYRQTIAAYPVNGGSYTVARENLGAQAGLAAGVALMLDYVLTVAVGISAGVAALVSAFPKLHPFTLTLCLVILTLITILNLRGTAEAGLVFSIPTYLFLATFAYVIGLGLFKTFTSGMHPQALIAPPKVPEAAQAFGYWILLRAFASGCTAMTGVEAVSNGVSAFKDPPVKQAHRVLSLVVVCLALLLGGIAVLCNAYHVAAMNQELPGYQSLLAQMVAAIDGRGVVYYAAIGTVLIILCLSANTSFVGFPRLCRLLAEDEFIPQAFAVVGRRLVYSVGILFLAAASAAFLIVFRGITQKLIPLYAVGAFLAFTLSQTGMVVHWARKKRESDAKPDRLRFLKVAVNATGAVATAVALVIILAAKFTEGAWITVIVIPAFLFAFNGVHRYYAWIQRTLAGVESLDCRHHRPPVVVIPMRSWNRLTDKALGFALSISDDVFAIHLTNVGGDQLEGESKKLQEDWAGRVLAPAKSAGLPQPQLLIVNSPYREFLNPLLDQLQQLRGRFGDRKLTVIIPQMVKTRWWESLLHDGRANRLRRGLLNRGGADIIVSEVPLHVSG